MILLHRISSWELWDGQQLGTGWWFQFISKRASSQETQGEGSEPCSIMARHAFRCFSTNLRLFSIYCWLRSRTIQWCFQCCSAVKLNLSNRRNPLESLMVKCMIQNPLKIRRFGVPSFQESSNFFFLAHALPIPTQPQNQPSSIPLRLLPGCLQAYRQALCRLPMYYFSHVVHFNLDPRTDGHDMCPCWIPLFLVCQIHISWFRYTSFVDEMQPHVFSLPCWDRKGISRYCFLVRVGYHWV